MKNQKLIAAGVLLALLMVAVTVAGCVNQPISSSGVTKSDTTVPVQSNGKTVEQNNIANRLTMENQPGHIEYLYVVSEVSGDCLFHSIVQGKVTSSGKRLNPYTASSGSFTITLPNGDNGQKSSYETSEVLQDDGTYGTSIDYLYWWDTAGRYRMLYPSAGTLILVSDTPITFPKVIVNIDNNGTAT